jgi:hypothetical protein
LAVVGIVAASAACDGSPGQRRQTSSSVASTAAEHAACRYLTSDIVANVEFSFTVNRIKDRADSGGVSVRGHEKVPACGQV